MERRDELRRRLAVERAAAVGEQGRLLGQRLVAVQLEQARLDVDDVLGAGVAGALLLDDPGGLVVVAQVVGGDGAERADELGRHARRARRSSPGRLPSSSGSRSTPSTRTARSQLRWLSPTCSSSTRSGVTPNCSARLRWMLIATLHRPIARWPPSIRAWVTIPTGLVKSTIQAPGAARRPVSSASSSTSGTVRSALAKPPAPVVSWPMTPKRRRQRLVGQPRGLAADAELDEHEIGAVDGRLAIAAEHAAGRPSRAGRASAGPGRRRPPAARGRCRAGPARRSAGARAPGEALDELRRVGAAAADDGDLDAHCVPSRLAGT